jgi:hypothetical protein
MLLKIQYWPGLLMLSLLSCGPDHAQTPRDTLFQSLPARETGITFENTLTPDLDHNIFEYDYFYNGGGVAAADFNNDGLTDLFLGGNQVAGKLYLNAGGFKFQDATEAAGIKTNGWCTGVSVADVNGDGWPDLYVSHAGLVHTPNQLFINGGKQPGGAVRFTEQAAAYGLDYRGFSTQAAFLDYDCDGDPDLYLLNHFHEKKNPNYPKTKVLDGSAPSNDRLYRNNGNGTFTDVSRESGITSEGYGLGIAVADLNADGWPDVYVANDFTYDDLVYINNRDGTFTEKARDYLQHTSRFSMGCDIADFNNDLRPDIFVADMLPDDNKRQKLMSIGINNDVFNFSLAQGYLPQYSRNALQLHNGLKPDGNASFSEIGQLAGVYKTDWSWSALFADLDNDGWKDLFVSNGIPRDITNLDFTAYRSSQYQQAGYDYLAVKKELLEREKTLEPVDKPNFAFRNNRDLTFSDQGRAWGLDAKGFSNGAVLADLDNDGDLDVVTNNLNAPPFVFRNNRDKVPGNHYLSIRLTGRFAPGTKVKLTHGTSTQYVEHSVHRGFQSTQEDRIHVGLGHDSVVDRLEVTWPDGRYQELARVRANQTLVLAYGDARAQPAGRQPPADPAATPPLFTDITAASGLSASHQENRYEDFNLEPLLPHRFSRNGPRLAAGDVNGDGLDDFWMSGSASVAGKLFLQGQHGQFTRRDMPDPGYEDAGGALFDADRDGDLDLYVVSGGNEYNPLTAPYQDRLYLNDGRGHFTRRAESVPVEYASGGVVAAADFDQDGDTDLFVGGRVVPGRYPQTPQSFLFTNDGAGRFTDATRQVGPALGEMGMVTDARWVHLDADPFPELVVVGEFMPVTPFKNLRGTGLQRMEGTGLESHPGWWYSLGSGDFDGDGDQDLVAGNLGLNNRWGATDATPVSVYARPTPGGSVLPVLTYFLDGQECTAAGRDQLAAVYPALKARFNSYGAFAAQTFAGLFPAEELRTFERLRATELRSVYLQNRGNGQFSRHPLPVQAQFAPVQAIRPGDFNHDGRLDVWLAGNDYTSDFMTGRYDASPGVVLTGDGSGNFAPLPFSRTGVWLQVDVRSVIEIEYQGRKSYVVGANDAPLKLVRVNEAPAPPQ